MSAVNIYEAKTHLSRLLRRVRDGEEIVIADAGRPVARLVPISGAPAKRVLGGDEGRVVIADDFDGPLPEGFLREFYGDDSAPKRPVRRSGRQRRTR